MNINENITDNNVPDWLKKCLTCRHCYTVQTEDGEYRCRERTGCKWEEIHKKCFSDKINGKCYGENVKGHLYPMKKCLRCKDFAFRNKR